MTLEEFLAEHPDNLDALVCRLVYRRIGHEEASNYRKGQTISWWGDFLTRYNMHGYKNGDWILWNYWISSQFPIGSPWLVVQRALDMGFVLEATQAAQNLRTLGIDPS